MGTPWGFPWLWVWDGYGDSDNGPVVILWRFEWCEVKRKRAKHAINAVVDV